MNKEFIKTTLQLLEQKLEKLDKEMSEAKAYVVVLKDALEQEDEQPTVADVLSKMPTGGIAIDLPKKIEKKLMSEAQTKARCQCRRRSLKIHPELCRTLVEAYEEYRTDPRGYGKMEVLNKLKTELNFHTASIPSNAQSSITNTTRDMKISRLRRNFLLVQTTRKRKRFVMRRWSNTFFGSICPIRRSPT